MTPELEQQVANCVTSEEITAVLRQAMLDQNLVRKDSCNPDILYENPRGNAFKKVVSIAGKNYVIEGANETDLLTHEAEVWRQASAVATAAPAVATTPQIDPARDAATGRFVEQPKAAPVAVDDATKAALSLQLTLGQIDVQTFLEKSGAIGEYLEKQGVPLAELQAVAEERQNTRFVSSWEQASEQFVRTHADWPGGEENKTILAQLVLDNGLMDADSKADAMDRAWKHMKANDLLVDVPETNEDAFSREMQSASTQEDIAILTSKYFPNSRSGRERSGIFNR